MTQFEQHDSAVQAGMMLIWSGEPGNIPAGWGICDGSNGTPDLRNRFPTCTSSEFQESGDRGGYDTYSLREDQMAAHNHYLNENSQGSHTHYTATGNAVSGDDHMSVIKSANDSHAMSTSDDGDHYHRIYLDSAGSYNEIDNRPAYAEAHYIMKL